MVKLLPKSRPGYGFETCERCGASGYDCQLIVIETMPHCDDCKFANRKINKSFIKDCEICNKAIKIKQTLCKKCFDIPIYLTSKQ